MSSRRPHPAALVSSAISGLVVGLVLTGCGEPPATEPTGSSEPEALFADVADSSGLGFHHFLGSTGEFFFPETAAAGAALFDYDGDGDLDAFLPQGTMLDPGKSLSEARFPPPAGSWPGDRLFRNDGTPTELRFVDTTQRAGISTPGYGMGVATGDYDNDGDTDLYVTRFGSNSLYRNDGDGRFTDVTAAAGVDDPRWSASASFLDYDRDGDLDLFVTNYVDFTIAGARPCVGPAGQRDYCGPMTYEPLPDRLFRNDLDRNGRHFTDVTAAAGLHDAFGSGLGVIALDFDEDGWLDLYVANDQRANQLWHNQGDSTFENVALIAGTAYNQDGLPEASMGVAAGDYDNDGDEDLLVAHLDGETNTLYRNLGGGTFVDATHEHGLGSPSRPFTGFGVGWLDHDNDGRLDLFVANGAVKVVQDQRGSPFPFRQRNLLFEGGGPAGRFEEIGERAGAALQLSEVSRGAAFGDVDNDGAVDVLVSNCNGPARLLRNTSPAQGWLTVALGSAPSGEAMGARVSVTTGDGRTQVRRVRTDGSYLSAHDPRVHIGLGSAATGSDRSVAEVAIRWPAGGQLRWRSLPVARAVSWIPREKRRDSEMSQSP